MEASDDLSNWEPQVTLVGSLVDYGDGTESVTSRDSQPIVGKIRRFMRLVVRIAS